MKRKLWEVTFQKDDLDDSYAHKHQEIHVFAEGVVEAAQKAEAWRVANIDQDMVESSWYISVIMYDGLSEVVE